MAHPNVEAHFRRLVNASEPGRLERERHVRALAMLRAMRAWDTDITELLAYETQLHLANVREIRHSHRVQAELELGRFIRQVSRNRDIRKRDPYALTRQEHRERVAVYRERLLTGKLDASECYALEKQSLDYCRTLIRRDKAIKAMTSTPPPTLPTLAGLRRMRGQP